MQHLLLLRHPTQQPTSILLSLDHTASIIFLTHSSHFGDIVLTIRRQDILRTMRIIREDISYLSIMDLGCDLNRACHFSHDSVRLRIICDIGPDDSYCSPYSSADQYGWATVL